jgi:hypothetical protein
LINLELLKVHCSIGLQISGLGTQASQLIGSRDKALKQDLEPLFEEHPSEIKPVLKLDKLSSR